MKLRNLILLAASLLLVNCTTVSPGERGLRVTGGSVQSTTLEPGFYFWVPFFYYVRTMSVRVQKSEVDTNAASKDMQTVTTKFALNWHIDPVNVNNVYSSLGHLDHVLENVISPAISEVLKACTAKKTAEEILVKRHELKMEVDKEIKERMLRYFIIIDDINIVNIEFSHDFAHAVEQKQVAEQRAKQATYEAIQAENDAKATVNHAKGQAEAQRLLRQTLTPELLQLKAVEKWNGSFPTVMGTNTLPFINLNVPHRTTTVQE